MPGAQPEGTSRRERRVAVCLPAFPRSHSGSDVSRTKDIDEVTCDRLKPGSIVPNSPSLGLQYKQDTSNDLASGVARLKALRHVRHRGSVCEPAHTDAAPLPKSSTLHFSMELQRPKKAIDQNLTDGFASPNREQVMVETTREEVKQYIKGPKQRQFATSSPAKATKHPAECRPYLGRSLEDTSSSDDDTHAEAHEGRMKGTDEDDCRRQQDQRPVSKDMHSRLQHASLEQASAQQLVHGHAEHDCATILLTGTKAAAAVPDTDTAPGEDGAAAGDLDVLIKDVAARIIQTHWRRHKQLHVTVQFSQAPGQATQTHTCGTTSHEDQRRTRASSGRDMQSSTHDSVQHRTHSPHSPGRRASARHSLRQGSPGRQSSPARSPSTQRIQPKGRAPPSYAAPGKESAGMLDGITESKTSFYKVYTVGPSVKDHCRRPVDDHKGMALASTSLLDADSVPLMAQPSSHHHSSAAVAGSLRSSIDSARRGTRRRMGAVGLSCDLQLNQQHQSCLEESTGRQHQHAAGRQDMKVSVQEGHATASHRQQAWEPEAHAGIVAVTCHPQAEAPPVRGNERDKLSAETSTGSTDLAEPSFNLEAQQAPGTDMDTQSLLRHLRAGQLPDGVEQEQLQMLLTAIGSARGSGTVQAASQPEAAQSGTDSIRSATPRAAVSTPHAAWAEPAAASLTSVPGHTAGDSGSVGLSAAAGCMPRSVRAREATREKLRNLRRSVHSSSGSSILSGHAAAVLRSMDQQGTPLATYQQQQNDRQPLLQLQPADTAVLVDDKVPATGRSPCTQHDNVEPLLQSMQNVQQSEAASTLHEQHGQDTFASTGMPAALCNVVGQADTRPTAGSVTSWPQACAISSPQCPGHIPSTPTKHTPPTASLAAASLGPAGYSTSSARRAAALEGHECVLPFDEQERHHVEMPHYVWRSPCSPLGSKAGNEQTTQYTPAGAQPQQVQPTPAGAHVPQTQLQQQAVAPYEVLESLAGSAAVQDSVHTVPLKPMQSEVTDTVMPAHADTALTHTDSQARLRAMSQPMADVPSQGAVAASPRSSMTTEKLRSILDFLDNVEQRSVLDAGHTAIPSARPMLQRPACDFAHEQKESGVVLSDSTAHAEQREIHGHQAASSTPMLAVVQQLVSSHTNVASPRAEVAIGDAAAAAQAVSAQCVADEVLKRAGLLQDAATGTGSMAVPASLNHVLAGQEESMASLGFDSSIASLGEPRPCWQAASAAASGQYPQAGLPRSSRASLGGSSHDGSVGTHASTQSSTAARPAVLAESVFDGVKSKMRKLQVELHERNSTCMLLRKELEMAQQRATQLIADTERRADEALAASRADHEAALARHLSFMDRLLADKDELNRKVLSMAEAAKIQEERHERTVAKLKDGWVSELKRQKEAWAVSERLKREQWQEAKTAEVKELTVKGLETEVQKLLAKHKSEVAAVQQSAAEESKRVIDVVAAQHELAIRQIKEKLAREGEDALEKERAAAAQRLREASERYEQQISMQRLRLVADGDLRLEQLEAARREERKRADDALAKAAADADARVKEMEEEARKERDALRRAHDKQMESLRQELSNDQEGWRTALAERSRRDLEQREAALMERLVCERDEQLQVVVQRLESEAQAAREAMRRDICDREATTASRHAAALKEAKRTQARLEEQLLAEGESRQAAETRLGTAQAQLEEARHELEARAATIRWLEAQLSAAQQQAQATEAARQAASNQALQEVLRDKEAADRCVVAIQQELHELRSRHAAEMEHVEARVRAALARKDELLSSSMQQVSALTAQLRHTEAVLAAQQAELGSM